MKSLHHWPRAGHQGLNQGLVGDSNGHDAKLLHVPGNLHCMLRLLAVLQGADPRRTQAAQAAFFASLVRGYTGAGSLWVRPLAGGSTF